MKIEKLFDLTGKTAVVTGAGNGIGRASALILAQAGANVVVSDLKEEDAVKVSDEIKAMGRRSISVTCNVIEDGNLVGLVEKSLAEFKTINILVNNVGIGGGGWESPEKVTVEYFEKVFKANVFAAWRLCQLTVPHMKKSGYGSIVNISSMSSVNASPGMSAYGSSKAAVNHMVANLAFDLGPEVRINAVGPGAIETAALKSVLTPEIEKKMLAHTPLGRLGQPEDIAGAVLYFASPVSSWVSGQTLFVNGGGVQTLD